MLYLKVVLVLLLVLVLIIFFGFILRRFGGKFKKIVGREGKLLLKDSVLLGGKKRLVLVGCEKKLYLILLGNNSDMVIDYYVADDDA